MEGSSTPKLLSKSGLVEVCSAKYSVRAFLPPASCHQKLLRPRKSPRLWGRPRVWGNTLSLYVCYSFPLLSKYHDLFLWAVCSAAKLVPFKTSAAVRTKFCNMTAILEGLAKCRALSHFLPRREHHYTYSSKSHVYSRSLRKRILGKNCSAVPVSRLRSS